MIQLLVCATRPDPFDGLPPEVRERLLQADAVVDRGGIWIPGSLDLSGLEWLQSIPPRLRVGGSLDLRGCPWVALRSDLEVGNTLYLDDNLAPPLPAMQVGCFVCWKGMCRLWAGPKTFREVS